MKRIFCIAAALFLAGIAISCKKADDNSVIIYTGADDFRVEYTRQLLTEQFPDYDITLRVLPTGNDAATAIQSYKILRHYRETDGELFNKLKGIETDVDIILNLETGYLEGLRDILADLSQFDTSEFLPELIPAGKHYLPWDKSSGAIVINRSKLESAGLPVPYSYRDLLTPLFKGLISMPNPKTSGAGYMFLVSLINAWGEDAAFEYFDRLAENILEFTPSDSGPVNALIEGEAAIGLGMTHIAVNAINSRGVPLELHFYNEGAPSITTGFGIIKGKETRPVVKEVFEFVMTKLIKDDKELFCPEPVMINQVNNIDNYPKSIPYANMDGVNDLPLKERLLEKWKY